VHVNGTSREELQDQLRAVCDALYKVVAAMERAAPNARDYYPLGNDAFRQAVAQDMQRRNLIQDMRKEYLAAYAALHE
jgi:hypothetical protein